MVQNARKLAFAAALILVLMGAGTLPRPLEAPVRDRAQIMAAPPEVAFMRDFVAQVNPSLAVEDPGCAVVLPGAIYRYAREHELDWRRILALAWQESDFDCHAKNRSDKGGAYGPFQIRRLWEPIIGDPRPQYYDPELAVERVVRVIQYYQETERYQTLVDRNFRNPLLCLYNTGETRRRVNMTYCRRVGRKLQAIQDAWRDYASPALRQAANDPTPFHGG